MSPSQAASTRGPRMRASANSSTGEAKPNEVEARSVADGSGAFLHIAYAGGWLPEGEAKGEPLRKRSLCGINLSSSGRYKGLSFLGSGDSGAGGWAGKAIGRPCSSDSSSATGSSHDSSISSSMSSTGDGSREARLGDLPSALGPRSGGERD